MYENGIITGRAGYCLITIAVHGQITRLNVIHHNEFTASINLANYAYTADATILSLVIIKKLYTYEILKREGINLQKSIVRVTRCNFT